MEQYPHRQGLVLFLEGLTPGTGSDLEVSHVRNQPAELRDLIDIIDSLEIPVVAAISGAVLG